MTPRSARPRRGEIWSFELGGDQPVPLALVQCDALNEAAPTVIGLVLTAKPQRVGEPLAVALDPEGSGLSGAAWLKVTQVRTAPASGAVERIGRVPDAVMARVDAALAEVLSLGGVSARRRFAREARPR